MAGSGAYREMAAEALGEWYDEYVRGLAPGDGIAVVEEAVARLVRWRGELIEADLAGEEDGLP
ncbi:MAG: hypothetical protein R6X20_02255, partial [Phycisphaerae bacterium]